MCSSRDNGAVVEHAVDDFGEHPSGPVDGTWFEPVPVVLQPRDRTLPTVEFVDDAPTVGSGVGPTVDSRYPFRPEDLVAWDQPLVAAA